MIVVSYAVSVSKSDTVTLSVCELEVASARLHLQESSVARAVVREST